MARISLTTRQRALKMFQKGKGTAFIVHQLGISKSTVIRWRSLYYKLDFSWVRNHPYRKTSMAVAIDAVRLYTKGHSYAQVAIDLGINPSSVRRYVQNTEAYGSPFIHRRPKSVSSPMSKERRIKERPLPKDLKTAQRDLREDQILFANIMLETGIVLEQAFGKDEALKKKLKFLIKQLYDHAMKGYPLPVAALQSRDPDVPFIEKLEAMERECRRIRNSVIESKLSKTDTNDVTESDASSKN